MLRNGQYFFFSPLYRITIQTMMSGSHGTPVNLDIAKHGNILQKNTTYVHFQHIIAEQYDDEMR